MNCFPDTSFLCALYRQQVNSPKAIASMRALTGALACSTLVLLEFRQSVRLQVCLHSQNARKGFSKAEGQAMLRDLQSDIANSVLEVVAVDWPDVHRLAEQLSAKYTEFKGYRLADILHVATALHLGVAEFLTFDDSQRALAVAEGLAVPL